VVFSRGDARKIVAVLRKKSGDFVQVVDSAASAFRAVLNIKRHAVSARLAELIAEPLVKPTVQVTVAQGVPKGSKMDFIIEKLTELGVISIVPFYSERSVVGDVGNTRVERWRRIARSAAAQCGRRDIPSISEPLQWETLLESFAGYDAIVFPWELAARIPMALQLPGMLQGAKLLLIVIGPEGGFSHGEVAQAEQRGARTISLGPRILRTETAALALCSVVNYLTGTY